MITLAVGHHYIRAISGTPAPAAGTITAASSSPGITVAHSPVDKNGAPADNAFAVTAVGPDNLSATITYSAPGYRAFSEAVVVPALPALVADDPVVVV